MMVQLGVLKTLTLNPLAAHRECLRKLPVAADLERAKVLVPVSLWDLGPRFNPQSKAIQIGDADRPVPQAVDQVLTDARRQIAPIVDLRHQLPKTIRPI